MKLGVNIDHIATLRQARGEGFPDPVIAASVCEKAGAEGITVHLREDRRHIQDNDVRGLKKSLKTKLNLEMAAEEGIINIALDIKPNDVCIVPEKRQELTTEGGLDVVGQKDKLKNAVDRLKSKGIVVSLFIDPEPEQIKVSAEIGADCIELHTGKYAEVFKKDKKNNDAELKKMINAVDIGKKLGLIVNAGHGLDYENVGKISDIKDINELNIGFSIIARSVFVGLENAVKEMKKLL